MKSQRYPSAFKISILIFLSILLEACKPAVEFSGQSLLDDQGNEYGELTWNITGKETDQFKLDSIEIDPEIGTVDATGSVKVYPAQTTTYNLTAHSTGPNNTVYSEVHHATIHVGPRVDFNVLADPALRECLEQTGFTHLAQFEVIYCVDRDIDTLDGIEQFDMTQSISLDNNRIDRLWPLSVLPALKTVSISGNGLTTLNGLAGSDSITTIVAFRNSIANVSRLAEMPQLLNLSLDENRLTDASSLSGLTHLQGLSLARNQVADVSPLAALNGLLALDISHNGVNSGIPQLKTLTKASVIRSEGNGSVRCIDYATLVLTLGPVVLFDNCKLF